VRDGNQGVSRRRVLATTAGLGAAATGLTGVGVATERTGGPVRWSFDAGAAVDSSPTVVAGTVFVGGGNTLYALDGATGRPVWSAGVGGPVSTPAVSGDTVFVGTRGENGGVSALSTATGEQEWAFEPDAGSFTTPAVAGGTVLVGNSQGDRVDVLLAADGEHLGAVEFAGFESIFSSVTRTEGTAFFGTSSFGPGGNGAVYAYGVEAGETDWTAGLPSGVQGSSPTVADGRVFVGTNIGRVYALSAATGEQEWVSGVGGGIESSPTVAGNRVFVGGSDGLSALSTAGDEDWSFETGGPVRSSPTVAGDRVFVGGPEGLYALSTAGERVWTVETDRRVDSSPTVVDGTVFVGAGDHVYAVDAGLDGSSRGSRVGLGTLGHHDRAGREPTVVVSVDQPDPGSGEPVTLTARTSGTVDSYAWDLTGNGVTDATGRIVTPNLDTGRHEVAVTVAGPAGEATARTPVSVPPAGGWRFDTGAAVETGSTVVDGTVYTATPGGVVAVTAAGDRAWRVELDDPGSPTVVDGRVFVGDDSGLTALDAGTGEVVWTAGTGPATSPTVAGGRVFAGGPDGLSAFSAVAGDREWTAETDGQVVTAPTVARETALAVDRTGTVFALAAASGGVLWTAEGSPGPGVSPTVADGRVFVGRVDGLSALALGSGAREWHAEIGTPTSPTVADGQVFVGGSDGLFALAAESGERVWRADIGGLASSPTVAGGRVFVGGSDGLSVLDAGSGELVWRFETPRAVSPPTVADGTVSFGADGLYALPATVDGSGEGSRAQLGTLGHPGDWRRADQSVDGDVDDESGGGDSGDESGPGLGVGAVVAALGGLGLLARRRGQSSAK